MPTDVSGQSATALFLFAHQDDEFGVFDAIASCCQVGDRVVCAYFTDGAAVASACQRNAESIGVLGALGVPVKNILFVGERLGIPDGGLCDAMLPVACWLDEFVRATSGIASVHVPAWEGGHHDHDALHAVVVGVMAAHGILPVVRQFSLYNARRCVGPFFRVLSPLPENGPVERRFIPWSNRLRFLGYCLRYPSQYLTWLGLFPFVVLHYILRGTQDLQGVNASRLGEKPHVGTLYYEKRGFYSWERMNRAVSDWKASFSSVVSWKLNE